MKRLIAALSLIAGPVFANELPRYEWDVLRVIDGDTVEIEAPYLPEPLAPKLSIRVYGVDTPEKGWRGQCEREKALGQEASDFTTQLIQNGDSIMVEIRTWDKFGGRVLGDLWIDGESLTALLIANGYARPYYGEAKQSWCDE
jgi:micrococcal nuclease